METGKIRRWQHISLTALVAAYMTFVFLVGNLISKISENQLAGQQSPLALYLAMTVFCFILCYVVLSLMAKFMRPVFTHKPKRSKLSIWMFLGVALPSFLLLLICLGAQYPGGFSPDNWNQWQQVHTATFNDHHPFFHTLLMFLITRIHDTYPFLVVVQIAAFSIALGYLAATLHAWGFRWWLVVLLSMMIVQPIQTRRLLMFFWKDTAMSIFFLFFLAHTVNIYLSSGEWLQKTTHWLSSAALLAGITLVRHNAILLTAPLLLLLVVSLPSVRRAVIRLSVLVVALVVLCNGPLEKAFQVEPSTDNYLELVGVPMTVLCSNYTYSPDRMPPESYQMMESFTSQEAMVENYQHGNFNSVKWTLGFTQEKIEKIPVGTFLRRTLDVVHANPALSVSSVVELTRMVWDPLDYHYRYIEPLTPPGSISPGFQPLPEKLQLFCQKVMDFFDYQVGRVIVQKSTAQLGVLLLMILLSWYVSVHNTGGWSSCWVVLPMMCYNFGTMLLLCGPDYRFFHLNCLAAYPILLMLLSKPREKKQTEEHPLSEV